jgi:hypothetical protein
VKTNSQARDIETNHTLNNEKIPFINQIPIFFYQKIQLEVAYKMTKPNLYIYMGLTTTSLWGSWVAAPPAMHL